METNKNSLLFDSLCKAQGDFPIITTNRENPFYRSTYADITTIIKTIRPILVKNNLVLTQQTHIQNETTILVTKLTHTSGEGIESHFPINPEEPSKGRSAQQAFGSALTYARRYQMITLLGITISDDPDDNNAEAYEITPEIISDKQHKLLEFKLKNHPNIKSDIINKLQLQSLADIPKNQFNAILMRVEELTQ